MLVTRHFESFKQTYRSMSFKITKTASALANEYYRSNTAFSIINGDSTEFKNLLGYRSRGMYDRRTPVVAVPANELKFLDFIDDEIKILFLRNTVVDIPAMRGPNFDRNDYVLDWIHRIKHQRRAVVLPEMARHFIASPNSGNFTLVEPAQNFVRENKLDTELYNAFAGSLETARAHMVIYCGMLDLLPAFVRIFSIDVDKNVSRFRD